jgi:deoxycytidylate deaminase
LKPLNELSYHYYAVVIMCYKCETRLKTRELSLKHYKWFEYAGLKAQESNMLFRLGCVATYGGKLIASGCNSSNTYSSKDDFCKYSCSCHAEICVIRKCLKLIGKEKMKRVNLYVARMDNNNKFKNSAPCYDCLKEIKKLKIKNIIFRDDISIKIMDPLSFDNDHRTFGYFFLKRTIDNKNGNKNLKYKNKIVKPNIL